MTNNTNSEDLREKILNENGVLLFLSEQGKVQEIYDSMDEYFTIKAKELLSWMAKHDVDCKVITGEGDMFYYKGELISADQLFENFL